MRVFKLNDHDYRCTQAIQTLILGDDAEVAQRARTLHTPGGTAALRVVSIYKVIRVFHCRLYHSTKCCG